MPRPDYDFGPLAAADLPLLRRWLAAPHVARWWGEPEHELALIGADLNEPRMQQYIVTFRARPFAYLQCYEVAAWADAERAGEPAGTRGIDQFIAEPDLIGRGHGPAFIRSFLDRLFAAGCPRVLTDPDPANARAIRAYQKAGFSRRRLVETAEGPRLLLTRDSDRKPPA